jgi:hypothetical protein
MVAPIIGWTDMLDALLPNGLVRENSMPPVSFAERLAEPSGVLKKSYIDRFYIGMQTFANVQGDLPDYIDLWYNTALEGEPYSNGTWFDATESLLANRSAYYIPADRTIPIVTVQGWNDHIFPVGQALSMLQRLTADDPNYPIKVLLNDFGHPIAQNPADQVVYQAYLINGWLDHYLRGKGPTPDFGVESFETVCSEMGEQTASNFLSDTLGGLSAAVETFEFDVTGLLDTEVVDPHANALDPFPISTPAGCRDTNTLIAEGNLAAEVESVEGFRMLGVPTVTFEAVPSASDMYVAFHLWDVSPDGETQALVDRGVIRLGAAGPQTVSAQLQGNNYDFGEGHFLKLELTANDTPSFRTSNAEGTIAITGLELFMPSANLDAEVQG